MTEGEALALVGFLVGGLLTGSLGHWLDVVVAFTRKK